MNWWHPELRKDPYYFGPYFRVDYDLSCQGVALDIVRRQVQGQVEGPMQRAQIDWVDVFPGEQAPHTLVCHDLGSRADQMQYLFDALWARGYRPREFGADPSATLQTKDAHLADLRKLLFNQLGIKDA